MNFKVVVYAFIIAAFAALGASRGALAGSGGTQVSDPLCTPLDSNPSHWITLCTPSMTVEVEKSSGIYVSIEPVPEETALPNAPRVNFVGPATLVKIVDSKGLPVKAVFMKVCFKDSAKANVFRWWTSADWKEWYQAKADSRWVYSTTSHSTAGMSCTTNWLPGIFTIN
jgi:hypothetical protein